MAQQRGVLTAIAVAALLTSGAVIAAETISPPAETQQQKSVDKDVRKMSVDGAKAFNDVTLARLAIFDGRTTDAKKLVDDAASRIDTAKTDETAFMKAEHDLKVPGANAADHTNKGPEGQQASTPVKWLPVDGEIFLDEDFSNNAKKTTAAADANKSLAKGDRAGAIEKLKLADINVDYVFAVVPLDRTVSDVHKSADLVNAGKYYEASQLLRQVQASARYDSLDINGRPKAAANAKTSGNSDANADAKAPVKN